MISFIGQGEQEGSKYLYFGYQVPVSLFYLFFFAKHFR